MKALFALPRRLYEWTLKWAKHPKGVQAYVFISFIESIFFPIPVDPLLMALCISKYKKSLFYAAIGCTASVLGGIAGYLLGFQAGDFVMGYIGSNPFISEATKMFQENTFYAMFLSGFTFLPFKVFTVTAGMSQVPLIPFILGSILGRGMRFFLVGGLIYFYGPTIKGFIDKYLEKIFMALLIMCALVFVYIKFIKA